MGPQVALAFQVVLPGLQPGIETYSCLPQLVPLAAHLPESFVGRAQVGFPLAQLALEPLTLLFKVPIGRRSAGAIPPPAEDR